MNLHLLTFGFLAMTSIVVDLVFLWQARIAEEIQQKNIQENFEAAIENTPEVFGHINMLYVDMKVGLSMFCVNVKACLTLETPAMQ